MAQEALLRPIEMSNSLPVNYITYDPDPPGGAGYFRPDFGVYASILTLISQIEAGIGASLTSCRLNSSYKVVFTWAASTSLEFLKASMQTALGFSSASYASATTHTAENVSPFIWLPTYESNNIEGWHQRKNYFASGMAVDGSRSGFNLGPTIYSKNLEWTFEPALNVYEEFATTATEETQCFMYFIRESITIQTSVAASNNISAKGFYYVPDMSVFYSNGLSDDQTQMGSGGINFSLASSPDEFVFCHYDGQDINKAVNSFGRARVRYNINLPVHTATAPTWLVDGTT